MERHDSRRLDIKYADARNWEIRGAALAGQKNGKIIVWQTIFVGLNQHIHEVAEQSVTREDGVDGNRTRTRRWLC